LYKFLSFRLNYLCLCWVYVPGVSIMSTIDSYDMIYLLTTIGLSPGGSSTVHIYTQTIHRTTRNKQYIEQHNTFGRVRAVPRLGLLYPGICLTTEEKAESRDSVVSITTRYGLEGPGIESRWGEIFLTYPERLRGPSSLLYNGYRVFPGGKGGRGVMLTTHPLLVPRLRKS
jgi:hypothetical protein